MLRSDTTALFERLREANILLQEVLSGAHENMSEIESTLVTRVADFVSAMNEVAQKTGTANTQVEQHITGFQTVTAQTLSDLSQLAAQFDAHGRSLAEAVALIDRSNRRTEGALTERRNALEAADQRRSTSKSERSRAAPRRASPALLDQSLEGANDRAREIARLVADSTTGGARAIAENFEAIRSNAEEERKRTARPMRTVYEQATGDSQYDVRAGGPALRRCARRASSRWPPRCSRSSTTTRTELRKGILELPQETAESAAQMRRVIVDQIEALAELNRIVARHGRGLDTVEPAVRRAEPIECGAPPGDAR